jgi:hypothetical protein
MTERKLYILIAGENSQTSLACEKLASHPSVAIAYNTYSIRFLQDEVARGRVDTAIVDFSSLMEDVTKVVTAIFRIREDYPDVVFCLIGSDDEFELRTRELPIEAKERLSHYYRLRRPVEDAELSEMIERCLNWHQSAAKTRIQSGRYKYDVALSFAGEDREHAEALAGILRENRLRVFYDDYEQARLWGTNLYEELYNVYANDARYCVVFVSTPYLEKMWTIHERRSAQDRVLRERHGEYLLPVQVDDAKLTAMPGNIAYLDLRKLSVQRIAHLFMQKLITRRGSFIS